MAELLIEFYSEEIPSGIQEPSVKNFESILIKTFEKAGLEYKSSETFWGPMRLVICINGMALKSKDIEIYNTPNGKPHINIKGHIVNYLRKKTKGKKYDIHLSLSDDKPWAQASVIICHSK